ncbi:hypothetical protein FXO38_13989 [Capsicum annuum]|nr:hypothetical protein FXO38_13989 [Capsicum annuum]
MGSPNNSCQWIHRMTDHTAAVKALSWCPFQSNMVASGGGVGDQCIKFWSTNTGACLNTVKTGSQGCSLLWNKHDRELLSSHSFTDNQLTVWKYPVTKTFRTFRSHIKSSSYGSENKPVLKRTPAKWADKGTVCEDRTG